MATPLSSHSSPSSSLPSPYSSPVLYEQPFPEQSAASERLRWPRKRRLTAPPDLQPGADVPERQANSKKARVAQGKAPEVHIVDEVDELIPKFRSMGKDSPLAYTPQSGGFDAAFIPFVFDDGVLSFYTPSIDSSVTGPSASPPNSSASSTSFLGVLPDHPRYSRPDPVFQGLTIWQGDDAKAAHIYAQTSNGFPPRTRETISLEDLDPSLTRYSPVHAAISQLPCQFVHVDIPLAGPPSVTAEEPYPISSIITITTSYRSPVRLMTALYDQGTLVSSHETQMAEKALPQSEGALYSASLPQELVDKFRQEGETKPGLDGEKEPVHSIAVIRFVQQDEKAGLREVHAEDIVLVVVCDFHAHGGALPGEVKVSHLLPGRQQPSPPGFLPTPPPSRGQRPGNRSPPKLSVAIPPSSMQGPKGRIHLYSESPGLTPDSSIRPTPQTGVPQNVLPMTPFEQLIHTPLHPPELQRNTRSRASYAPTPAESAYPFTLSSTSPDGAQSPAFGVLDMAAGPGGSAPARFSIPRNATPITPTFFLQHPHTASASNAMSSMTQRALEAGAPAFPSLPRRSGYFDQPLASPLSIASAPPFPLACTDSDTSAPATAPGWPSGMRSAQSS